MSKNNEIIEMILKESTVFPSQKALEKYLKEHPGADKNKHRVLNPKELKERFPDKPSVKQVLKEEKDIKKEKLKREKEIEDYARSGQWQNLTEDEIKEWKDKLKKE